MAIDVYLQLDGIRGESSDSQHGGWIECQTVTWHVAQPRSSSSSTAGGHTAERCVHSGLDISKLSDISTPLLLQYCSAGKIIPNAKIEMYRADGAGAPVRYFSIELTNVLVRDVAPGIYEGIGMSEHLALVYSKVKWQYTQQSVRGGTSGQTVGGWDLSANRIA